MKNISLPIHRIEGHPILRFVAGRMLVCDSASPEDYLADEVAFPIPPSEWERVARAVEAFNAALDDGLTATDRNRHNQSPGDPQGHRFFGWEHK